VKLEGGIGVAEGWAPAVRSGVRANSKDARRLDNLAVERTGGILLQPLLASGGGPIWEAQGGLLADRRRRPLRVPLKEVLGQATARPCRVIRAEARGGFNYATPPERRRSALPLAEPPRAMGLGWVDLTWTDCRPGGPTFAGVVPGGGSGAGFPRKAAWKQRALRAKCRGVGTQEAQRPAL